MRERHVIYSAAKIYKSIIILLLLSPNKSLKRDIKLRFSKTGCIGVSRHQETSFIYAGRVCNTADHSIKYDDNFQQATTLHQPRMRLTATSELRNGPETKQHILPFSCA